MKNFILVQTLIALAATSASAASVLGGVIALTQAAVPLSINGGSGSQFVQRVTVKIVPGTTCKAYVGSLGHTRSNLAGVYAVLFPNYSGGHSEQFTLEDPRGTDGINLATLALSGDCAGEPINIMYFQTGQLSATAFRVFGFGPLAPPASTNALLWGGSTTLAALVEVRVIPGYSGKMRIKSQQLLEVAQLFPNTGNPQQHNAHSEAFKLVDRNGGIRPDLIYLSADVTGEKALVLLATYN